MKKLFTLFVIVALPFRIFAQPERISYQAIIRNSSGQLVSNHSVGLRISILPGSTTGAPVYVETHLPTTNANGLVTIEIGGGNIVAGLFTGIDWSTGNYFIKTETDPTGGANYTITGTSQLLSVPYALYSKNAVDKAYVDALLQRLQDLEGIIFTQLLPSTEGLVAYYPFNGNANDESGNNNHGTVSGATLTMDRNSKVNKAYSFDGVNDYIDIGNKTIINSTLDTSFTISVWYKTNSGSEQRLFEKRDFGYKGFSINTWGNSVGIFIGDGTNYTTTPYYSYNQYIWNHYVCIVNKSEKKVYSYVNGILGENVVDISNISTKISNLQPAKIGINVNLERPFSGLMDDIRIYDRILNNTEIQLLYNEGGLPTGEDVTDIEGNSYKTVKLGSQIWMTENLKTTKYQNGSLIPNVPGETAWSNLTTDAYCYYDNNPSNGTAYGCLYNFYAIADSRHLCPTGWHVPTDAEWMTLQNYLIANGYNYDGTTTENKIAKSIASAFGWSSSTVTGSIGNSDFPSKRNASNFTALPGGYRNHIGIFHEIVNCSYWWSSTELDASVAWDRRLYNYYTELNKVGHYKKFGMSVRCIKDN